MMTFPPCRLVDCWNVRPCHYLRGHQHFWKGSNRRGILMISALILMLSFSTVISRSSAFAPSRSSVTSSFTRKIHSSRLSMSSNVRVTTYNVLSSHLGGADYFTSCRPEHLDAKYRLKQLQKKLDIEIEAKAIICLQEVSTPWAGALHVYFANRGYHMVTGLYGNKFNGWVWNIPRFHAHKFHS